jgi:hypothetical protein
MSWGGHLVFAIGARRWLIASATVASVFLAAAAGTASAARRVKCITDVVIVDASGPLDLGNAIDAKERLTLIEEHKWPTDTWVHRPSHRVGRYDHWSSDSGDNLRCHTKVRFRVECGQGVVEPHTVEGERSHEARSAPSYCWGPMVNEGYVDFAMTVSAGGSLESKDCRVKRRDIRPWHLKAICEEQAVHKSAYGGYIDVVSTLRLCTSYINTGKPGDFGVLGRPTPEFLFPPGIKSCSPI